MSAQNAVLFDLDGTLVDAFDDIARAVNAALREASLPTHPPEVIRGMVGSGIRELCRRAAPGLPEDRLDALTEAARAAYHRQPVVTTRPYSGIMEALAALRAQGIRTAVVSNKPHALTVEVCRQLRITDLMDAVQGEDPPYAPRKPSPQMGLRAIAAMGATRAVMVGDMGQDGQFAAALGIPFVGVAWGGGSRREIIGAHPVALCEAPAELPRAVVAALEAAPDIPIRS